MDIIYSHVNKAMNMGSTYATFRNTPSIVLMEDLFLRLRWPNELRSLAQVEETDAHEYDGNGRRMRSKLANAANWTNFIHDELTENLICEYTLISGTYTIKALNTYGLGLISSNRNGTVRYFHFDGPGTTAHLTDSSQDITDSYAYDAFGNPLSASGSSVNPYRYVGQWGYYDDGAMGSSSEMLLLGVRYYWPRFGRLTTWDSVPQSNLYGYVSNQPVALIDVTGEMAGRRKDMCSAMGCPGKELALDRPGYSYRSCCCTQNNLTRCCVKLYACGKSVRDLSFWYEDRAEQMRELNDEVASLMGILGELGKIVPLISCGGATAIAWARMLETVAARLPLCAKSNGCACIKFCFNNGGMPYPEIRCCNGY